MIRKFLLVLAGAAAALTPATPALAASPSSSGTVAASVVVAESLSFVPPGQTVSLGNVVPGSTGTATVTYSVSTNDTSGYTLTITPATGTSQTAECDGDVHGGFAYASGSACISNYPDFSITEQATAAGEEIGGSQTTVLGWQGGASGTDPTVINVTSAPSDDTYTEAWALQVPASAPQGTASETLTYTVAAN